LGFLISHSGRLRTWDTLLLDPFDLLQGDRFTRSITAWPHRHLLVLLFSQVFFGIFSELEHAVLYNDVSSCNRHKKLGGSETPVEVLSSTTSAVLPYRWMLDSQGSQ
jgi:hypothetical protein